LGIKAMMNAQSGQWVRQDGTVLMAGVTSEVHVDEALVDLSSAWGFSCGLTTEGYVRCFGSRVR
jgi:hypothetical protein